MNQEKIGKFIAECRKERGLKQNDLAEILGVSDRTVGNWENGRNMPDLSLFEPLCNILEISLVEFLRGEKMASLKSEDDSEDNILATINYSNKLLLKKDKMMGTTKILIGSILIITSLFIYESSFNMVDHVRAILCLCGVLLTADGIANFQNKQQKRKNFAIVGVYVILMITFLLGYDYFKV